MKRKRQELPTQSQPTWQFRGFGRAVALCSHDPCNNEARYDGLCDIEFNQGRGTRLIDL